MQKYLFEILVRKMSKEKVIIHNAKKSTYIYKEFRVNMNDKHIVKLSKKIWYILVIIMWDTVKYQIWLYKVSDGHECSVDQISSKLSWV